MSIETSNFPDYLKTSNFTSAFKKDFLLTNQTIDLLVFTFTL